MFSSPKIMPTVRNSIIDIRLPDLSFHHINFNDRFNFKFQAFCSRFSKWVTIRAFFPQISAFLNLNLMVSLLKPQMTMRQRSGF